MKLFPILAFTSLIISSSLYSQDKVIVVKDSLGRITAKMTPEYAAELASREAAEKVSNKPDECPAYSKAMDEHRTFFVVVSAKWCPACRAQEKRMTDMGIPFVTVDVDEHPKLAEAFYHEKIPQTYLIIEGKGIRHVVLQIIE